MAFPTRLLIEGEELVMDLRPHWIALIMPAIATLATFAVMLVLYGAFDENILDTVVGIAGTLFLLAYPVRKLVDWLTSHFVVTSDRMRSTASSRACTAARPYGAWSGLATAMRRSAPRAGTTAPRSSPRLRTVVKPASSIALPLATAVIAQKLSVNSSPR